MDKIGIFYGSTLGHNKKVAERIQQAFGADFADLCSIADAKKEDIEKYDRLILGTSTWGVGEMQEDWETFVEHLDTIDLSGKKVALFGVGDQHEWSDSFVNGMGVLHHKLKDKTTIVGFTAIEGYDFEISLAVKNDQFVGLVIDDNNQSDLTLPRIKNWVEQLELEFAG
jgi:flavodoxin I